MALFPGALPVFAGFTSGHTLLVDNHGAQHNLEQAEVVQIATKVGTGSSAPTGNTVLRGTGVGTSSWAQVALTTDITGVLPVANGGTGQASLTSLPLVSPAITGTVSGGATYTTPVLTVPVIADFTGATHTHASNSQGGQLGTSALMANTVGISRLASVESTDLFNNTPISATTWTDFKANQNFTVDNANSVILVSVNGQAQIGGGNGLVSSRIVIDSAGTPILRYLGGNNPSGQAGGYTNPFGSGGFFIITGLALGTHTIKTQVYVSAGSSVLYARCATFPDNEFFSTYVLELKA